MSRMSVVSRHTPMHPLAAAFLSRPEWRILRLSKSNPFFGEKWFKSAGEREGDSEQENDTERYRGRPRVKLTVRRRRTTKIGVRGKVRVRMKSGWGWGEAEGEGEGKVLHIERKNNKCRSFPPAPPHYISTHVFLLTTWLLMMRPSTHARNAAQWNSLLPCLLDFRSM